MVWESRWLERLVISYWYTASPG